jgi:hypothetical protein
MAARGKPEAQHFLNGNGPCGDGRACLPMMAKT